jgi:hypothetical protein
MFQKLFYKTYNALYRLSIVWQMPYEVDYSSSDPAAFDHWAAKYTPIQTTKTFHPGNTDSINSYESDLCSSETFIVKRNTNNHKTKVPYFKIT